MLKGENRKLRKATTITSSFSTNTKKFSSFFGAFSDCGSAGAAAISVIGKSMLPGAPCVKWQAAGCNMRCPARRHRKNDLAGGIAVVDGKERASRIP